MQPNPEKEVLLQIWQSHKNFKDARVLHAFESIRREEFIRPLDLDLAYKDHPLPIGFGQTISQPTTVMIMLELLQINPSDRVLEIGTGSGFNAALLATLAHSVVSIESVPELVEFAQDNLKRHQLENVTVINGDGKLGFPEKAPYDRIIITAASQELPLMLWEQLKIGGILVAPIGFPYSCEMFKIQKTSTNERIVSKHGYFSFVPLV